MGSWTLDFYVYNLKLFRRLLNSIFYINNTDVATL